MRPRTYHDKVLAQQPFRAGNKYATNECDGRLYVVWSYGSHWPLYIHDRKDGTWYENESSIYRSQSTRRHAQVCRPTGAPTLLCPNSEMLDLIDQATKELPQIAPVEEFEDLPF